MPVLNVLAAGVMAAGAVASAFNACHRRLSRRASTAAAWALLSGSLAVQVAARLPAG